MSVEASVEPCPECGNAMGIIGDKAFCSRCPNIEDEPRFLEPATTKEVSDG